MKKKSRFRSRAARKFFRNRLAVGWLLVIGLYFVIAFSIGVADFLVQLVPADKSTSPVTRALSNLASYVVAPAEEGDAPRKMALNTTGRVATNNVPGFFRSLQPEKRLRRCEFYLTEVERALLNDNASDALAELKYGSVSVASLEPEKLTALIGNGWKLYEQLDASENLDEQQEALTKLDELETIVTQLVPPPTSHWQRVKRFFEMILGTDRQGRSIFYRALHSIKTALQIGVVTALISVIVGGVLGAAAGFWGGWGRSSGHLALHNVFVHSEYCAIGADRLSVSRDGNRIEDFSVSHLCGVLSHILGSEHVGLSAVKP